MRLKLIVASMSVLGFMSSAAYAAEQTNWAQPYLDSMSQNTNRAKPTVDCNKPIAFAGGINFDFRLGNRHIGYMGENTERFSLNDAYLNATARVNPLVKGFIEFSYNNATEINNNDANGVNPTRLAGGYSNVYPGTASGQNGFNNLVGLQQGFVTFGNLDAFPAFIQIGRQFEDYGRYQIHPITRSLTQELTETLRTSMNLAFVLPMGLHGQVYMFDSPQKRYDDSHSYLTYGVALGFDKFCDQLGYGLNLGYLSNMFSVNDIDYVTRLQELNNGFAHRVGSWDINGHVNYGPFSLMLEYTASIQYFSPYDILPRANANPNSAGASPWAASGLFNYAFDKWCKNQNVYVGYQAGGDLPLFLLPSNRWIAGYNIDLWKQLNLGLEYSHDHPYAVTHYDSGTAPQNSNAVTFRAAVKFG